MSTGNRVYSNDFIPIVTKWYKCMKRAYNLYSFTKIYAKNNYVAASFVIYLVGTVFLKGISVITTPIFTRILSTAEYGTIAVFMPWVQFFAVFIGLQVSGSIATARVHKPSNEFESYMNNITLLSLLASIIISSVILLFRKQISIYLDIDLHLIPHLLIQAYGVACSTIYTSFTIQTKKPKQNVIFSVIVATAITFLSLLLVLNFTHDKYMGKIYALSLVNSLIIIYVLKRFLKKKYLKAIKNIMPDWRYALALGSPLIIHLLSNIVIGQSNRLFLNSMISKESAAIFSVAYSVGILGMMLVEVSGKVWGPWYMDNTKAKNNLLINDGAKKYITGVSLAFVTVMLTSTEIIKIMAPKQYWSGTSSLVIITTSVFFQFLYRFSLAYEQYSRNMKWIPVSTIITAFINMGLNYIFINSFGMIGASMATFFSYICLFAMHEYVARKIIGSYNIKFNTYLPGIMICLIFGLVSYFTLNFAYIRYIILFLIFAVISYFIKTNKFSKEKFL